jgi:hypothetical protein
MAGIESNSTVLPPITSGTADSWSFDSASISDQSEPLGTVTEPEPGDQPAPDDAELATEPAAPAAPKVEAKPEAPAQPSKKRQTITERTNVLKAELAQTLRERAQAREELADLQRQRDALRGEVGRQPAPPRQEPARSAPPPASTLGPKPEWDKFEADGKSWKEYEDAKDAWLEAKAEEKATARIKSEIASIEDRRLSDAQRAREAEIAQRYAAKMDAVHAKYPDFAAQVDANLAGVQTSGFMKAILVHHAQGGEVLYHWARHPHQAEIIATFRPTRPIMDAVATAEDPIPLLSHFAEHRAEFEALTQMPPARQLLELGRLQQRLEGASRTSDPPSRSSVKSPAPPFRAMGGTAAAVSDSSETTGDDFADWVRAENRRQAQRAGR